MGEGRREVESTLGGVLRVRRGSSAPFLLPRVVQVFLPSTHASSHCPPSRAVSVWKQSFHPSAANVPVEERSRREGWG